MNLQHAIVVLNDDETWTSLEGCTLRLANGDCYSLEILLNRRYPTSSALRPTITPIELEPGNEDAV